MSRLRRLLLMDEHTCPWWFVLSFDNPLRRLVQRPRTILRDLVKEGDSVVDVGCGAGYFSLGLAQLVGAEGEVIALDIQPEMLNLARLRAKRRGLDSRIEFRLCEPENLGLENPVDFVLGFWMVHEVPDQLRLLSEIMSSLKPSGRFLLVEPKVHVPARRFARTVELAKSVGFDLIPGPKVWFSRSIVCSGSGPGSVRAP